LGRCCVMRGSTDLPIGVEAQQSGLPSIVPDDRASVPQTSAREVPRLLRPLLWFVYGAGLLFGVGGVVGGAVRVVVSIVRGNWSNVAIGFGGMILGATILALASSPRPRHESAPTNEQ
jgi:hypothetical protein